MKPIIEVNNLYKKYRIGKKQRYYSFRDTLADLAKLPFNQKAKSNKGEFWALKDISFNVMPGEVIGIIGRNGAGKSTLLKILSQITPPTEGEIILRGRVASLLEVGTGFHPELTGRENIYLNGAILGMKRWEINKKFDEIVEFAEISKFLDTPVKHFSSGMYVRLAFAVAAHLDPEILLVDEVLAVGDAEFQKKCLGKMGEVAKAGRTVLFVSHNMDSLKKLCTSGLLIKNGKLDKKDDINTLVNIYLNNYIMDNKSSKIITFQNSLFFKNVRINHGNDIICGGPLELQFNYKSNNENTLNNCRIAFAVNDNSGDLLFICSTEMTNKNKINLSNNNIISCFIDNLPLSSGRYRITLFSEINGEIKDWIKDAFAIEVSEGTFFNGLRQTPIGSEGRGVLVAHRWKFN